jgi:Eukaryotic membrane protein family
VDVLEAVSGTCTLFTQGRIGLMPLVSDVVVALMLTTAHGAVLMCQAMVFAVSMNSKANALLALLIAANFVELKGQVYKRTDTNKLWTLACQVGRE